MPGTATASRRPQPDRDGSHSYAAFICYQHESLRLAANLQVELTRLGRQLKVPVQIFRDATDIPTGPLEPRILNALRRSDWLIVICSPRSASSDWMQKETAEFLKSAINPEQICLVKASPQTDLRWDDNGGLIDGSHAPPALIEAIRKEQLYADLRPAARSARITNQVAFAQLAHNLFPSHSVETIRRVRTRQKQKRQAFWATASVILIVALASAFISNREASALGTVQRLRASNSLTNQTFNELKLEGEHISNKQMQSTRLDGASIVDSTITDTALRSASLRESKIESTELTVLDLSDASLNGATISSTSIAVSLLNQTNMSRTAIDQTSIVGSILFNVNLSSAQVSQVRVRNSLVWGLDMSTADVENFEFVSSILLDPWFPRDRPFGTLNIRDSVIVVDAADDFDACKRLLLSSTNTACVSRSRAGDSALYAIPVCSYPLRGRYGTCDGLTKQKISDQLVSLERLRERFRTNSYSSGAEQRLDRNVQFPADQPEELLLNAKGELLEVKNG